MITPQQALVRLIEQREIFYDEMLSLMRQIMSGEVSPAQIAGILVGLRVKKETVGEISAAAYVMREFATKVPVANRDHLVDTCGTGGDSISTFNVSTTSALVAAAAGARVAKHGGRSVSSTCGSADVLEKLGVNINLTPEQVGQCVDNIGIGFMFAPNFHGAMKYAAPVRRELGVRTMFNVLGPLTNPAGAENQVLGVFHPDLVGIMARVLQRLNSRHVLVVNGMDGMDEISISTGTFVAELKNGQIDEYEISPEQFGFSTASNDLLRVSNVDEACGMLQGVLDDKPGAPRDIVTLNAGAAIYVSGLSGTLVEGVDTAREMISSGRAKSMLEKLIRFSSQFKA